MTVESLRGLCAVVTGAAVGIGRGIAEELVRNEVRVVVADVDLEGARATARELGALAVAAEVDVTEPASVEALRDRSLELLGHVQLLVNNAGILTVTRVLDMDVSEWDRVLAVNARGVFLCSKAFGAHMVGSGGGCIVNIASVAGKEGNATLAHYAASKFAVVGFTQALAKELAPANVRVNAICPGTVTTPMMEDLAQRWGTTVEAVAAAGQLVKRPQHPREIGAAVVFLASMPSITGQAINVDGGCVFH